jgi:hypothetical protein
MLLAPWAETRWITLSSCLLLLPSYYAYLRQFYIYSAIILGTSIVSANYWRHATYSWRRTLDLWVAKGTVTFFTVNGVLIYNIPYMVAAYGGLIPLAYCYYLSDTKFRANNAQWVLYHFLFHCMLIYETLLIIHIT